jgi:ribonuclease-3
MEKEKEKLEKLQTNLKYCFRSKKLLKTALTHISYAKEKKLNYNYEKLEFLGDSLVNFLIIDILAEKFAEFHLARQAFTKAYLISEKFLSKLAKKHQLEKFVYLSKKEEEKGRREDPSILADVFEALWASIYIDSGKSLEFVKNLFRLHYAKDIIEAVKNGEVISDYKTLLQDLTQRLYKKTPSYELVKAEGPPHDKTFVVKCSIDNYTTFGVGKNKKEAEQNSAEMMLKNYFREYFEKFLQTGRF